jgi:two-component system chemotaxis sensor kinase CheA
MAHDPYKYFRIEAREVLDQLVKDMLVLETAPLAPEVVQRLFRYAHTLKGAARVVKQKEIADHAHAVEDTLAVFRDGTVAPSRERVDAVLRLLDAIGERVAALTPPAEPSAAAEPRPPPEPPLHTLRADVEDMDALADSVAAAHVQLAALRLRVGTLDRIRHLQDQLAGELRAPRSPSGDGASGKAIAILEELGGLLTAAERNIGLAVEQTDRELRQVREAAERLRLSPVRLMFNALERTARDAAQTVGRPVTFDTHGGEVRLDAHVLGIVQSALVQVVRNAVAHGVESASERAAAGKPRVGKVTLEVVRRGNRVSFACRDDGRGIDVEAVRRAAQRNGALPADAQKAGLDELIRLLLKGGITTSGTVTEVSGRGIGLDVVREAAARLGGEVNVRSEAHKGTTIEILVPVSLTALDALLVEADARTAVIPLDAVRQTLRLRSADVARTSDGESIVIEGQVIPFAPLHRSLRSTAEVPVSRSAWSAVVIEGGGSSAAVGVDRLLGTENVVLRPLPRLCPVEPVVAGASLDAEGNPMLVLDPEALVSEARRASRAPRAAPAERPRILVIDDSLTTRMLEQSILESAGYEVDLAISGEEGLHKAHHRRYALFLVDVEMPGMDGFEFIARVRADADLRTVPAMLVTSRNAPEDRRRGEEVGAVAYIVKSEFDQTELLGRIRALVGN